MIDWIVFKIYIVPLVLHFRNRPETHSRSRDSYQIYFSARQRTCELK